MMESDGIKSVSIPTRENVLNDADMVFHIMESIKDSDTSVAVRALTNWSTAVNRTVSAACQENANAWRDLMRTHFKEWLEVPFHAHAKGWPHLGQRIAASDAHPRTCVKALFDATRAHRLHANTWYETDELNNGVLDSYARFLECARREYRGWKRWSAQHSVNWHDSFHQFANRKYTTSKPWELEVFTACYYVDCARRIANEKRSSAR